ncbi:MAG: hypothetical protein CME65_13235 [Halobacteriovoraceae bacterium]|nr:hypothetical protein [Halobacteriovoraceae bacterium]
MARQKLAKKFAIVDIETTGANRGGNKITEIAIIVTDGTQILDEFSTLLNPERSIPSNITYLTGITNEMVRDKPKFYEIAKKIVEITEGCVFVAHNVFFDYNFIRSEFNELGFSYGREKLCTVRMSRKAFPGLKSYSLGNLTKHFKIPLKNHHRAMADAKATLELFKLIQAKLPDLTQNTLEEKTRILTPPPNFETKKLEDLPEKAGLYYFYNDQGELLYIGKSKNIRKRVINHFRPNIKRKKDLQLKFHIFDIQTKLTGNELAALILESHEIKHFRPPYNTALKASRFRYHVVIKDNTMGIPELKISTQDIETELPFKSKSQAKRAIEKFLKSTFGVSEYEYIDSSLIKFFKVLGYENYKSKLESFFDHYKYPKPSFYITLPGRKRDEKCLIQVRNNALESLVYIDNEGETERIPLIENRDHRLILLGHINKFKLKVLEGEPFFG